METVEPYYLKGLIFAVPFIAFGLVTFFTVNEKLKMGISSAITAVLIVVLGFTSLLAFIYINQTAYSQVHSQAWAILICRKMS